MDTLQKSLKPYEGNLFSFAAFISAMIVGYSIVAFGVPAFFPNTSFNDMIASPLKVKNLSIPLTIGSCSFSSGGKEINTSNPYRGDFLYMPNSNNQKDGAEFSYSFWLKLTSSNLRNSGKVIFTRGVYSNRYNNSLSPGRIEGHEDDTELLVKCPLVRFGASQAGETAMTLEVLFNTVKEPHNTVRLDSKVFDTIRSTTKNPKWSLVCISFRDFTRNVALGRNTNGVEVQVYLNDALVKTHVIENDAIKLNQGDVLIMPNRTGHEDSESDFSNLTYHNFALDMNDVTKLFEGRANEGGCNYPILKDTGTLGLSMKNQYYRLSLHQQLRQI